MCTHIFHCFIQQVIGECLLCLKYNMISWYYMAGRFVGYTHSLVVLVTLK